MAAAAAQEPARSSSSSGSADSYIGSLISLTSKSEIRYEGVLFNINTEESSIGLRNVRSFGTEGRRKDGPQVPPSDKVYEYILFRGSDIKDLQVKSSPPVQSTAPIHHDPAIIQSHYPPPTMPSTSLPPSGAGSVSDPTTNTSQLGIPRPTLQGSPPLYQPGANLGGWVSSPLPTSNNGGLPMPMYWQGLYGGPPNGPQGQHVAHQQPLLQPPPGLSMLPSMQQPMQYPPMNLSLHTGASQLSEQRPPLLPPFSTGNMNLMPPMLSAQSSAVTSDPSANLTSDKSSTQTLPTMVPSNSLPLLPPLTTALENTAVVPSVSEGKSALLSKNMPESASSIVGTSSSILNDGKMPALLTPEQLLQPGMPTVSSSHSSQTVQKDVEVVQLTSSDPLLRSVPAPALAPGTTPAQVTAATPAPAASAADVQEPILPLPPPASRRLHGAHVYTPHYHHRGRGRGRGSELSRSATRFTEDFDFTAMNEKFNKDEVWGHLGKSNRAQEDGDDLLDEENVGSSKNESNPTYVKDDFFDSLSCDALDGGSRNGRPRFSEQVRRDTETFGNFPRYHGGRGGRGPYRGGGRGRGPYHGRGYGYGYGYNNRGRGGYGMSRHAP